MGKLRVEQTGINESSGGVYAHPFRAPEAAPVGSRRGACRGEANSCRGGRPRVAGWVVTKPCQLWCGRPVLRRPRRRGPGLRAHHGQRPVPSWNTCPSVSSPARRVLLPNASRGGLVTSASEREASSASTSSASFMLHAHHPVPVCVPEHVRAVLPVHAGPLGNLAQSQTLLQCRVSESPYPALFVVSCMADLLGSSSDGTWRCHATPCGAVRAGLSLPVLRASNSSSARRRRGPAA